MIALADAIADLAVWHETHRPVHGRVTEIDNLLSALQDRLWRPIDTAPRDGTRILAFGEEIANSEGIARPDPAGPRQPGIHVVWFLTMEFQRHEPAGELNGEAVYRRIVDIGGGHWAPFARRFFPTHWQPLPEPLVGAAVTRKDEVR